MAASSPVRAYRTGVRIDLRVIPRAPRTIVDGLRDARLVVRVAAPPVDGAANAAVIDAMAERLGVGRRAVAIVAGESARNKTVTVDGISVGAARARLGLP